MIRSLLIANRGEIACRIITTARRLGIGTVAVASEPDRTARHSMMADACVMIGGDTAASSYLDQDKIIKAARAQGVDAVHPGYGFLSETPQFVEAVEAAGLIFIGPDAAAIRAMGLKDEAKRLMASAGVPVVPGYEGAEQDEAVLLGEARRLGFPLMIKARAGGGGTGMRRVAGEADFIEALRATKREAKASFGDEHVLLERYIAAPRHIEVQIFADGHGNIVHLYERDCTLQRRHQKVLEEAPAPGMTQELRQAMTAAALAAGRAIDYRGAGTVEFIVDARDGLRADGFWFMEMNTRLQVEHPVTEMITGFDLVEWQMRVASGEELPVKQEDIRISGHAVEARLYAEDVCHDFLPAPGAITSAAFPQHIRVDHGINETDSISPYYDPMIAKLVAHGADRTEAMARLKEGLCGTHITGTATNSRFLAVLASHEDVAEMRIDTTWIERESERLKAALAPSDADLALLALVHLGADGGIGFGYGWRLWGWGTHSVRFRTSEAVVERCIIYEAGDVLVVEGGEAELRFELVSVSDGALVVSHESRRLTLRWVACGDQLSVDLGGSNHRLLRVDPLAASGEGVRGSVITAPMTGVITVVACAEGGRVAEGDVLLRLEAMKMEHALVAPCGGRVLVVACGVGETVADGAVLVELEADG